MEPEWGKTKITHEGYAGRIAWADGTRVVCVFLDGKWEDLGHDPYWVGKIDAMGMDPNPAMLVDAGLSPDGITPLAGEELEKLAEEIRIHNAEIEKEAKRRGFTRGTHGYYVGQRIPFEKDEGK